MTNTGTVAGALIVRASDLDKTIRRLDQLTDQIAAGEAGPNQTARDLRKITDDLRTLRHTPREARK